MKINLFQIADMYHDQSIGNLIDIVIVRIVYLEKEEDEVSFRSLSIY